MRVVAQDAPGELDAPEGDESEPAPVDGAPEPAASPDPSRPVEAICNGSDAIRVAHYSTIGFSDTDPFWDADGSSFLVVDGQCRFWEATNGSGRVRTGVLDEERALALAESIDFGNQASWPAIEDDCTGPDALPESALWTEQRSSRCCNCNDDVDTDPSGWGDAVVWLTLMRLSFQAFPSGVPLTGPVRLAFSILDSAPTEREPAPWPLPRPPATSELLGDANLAGLWISNDFGTRITDPAELELLRSLRDEPRREFAGYSPPYLPVLVSDPGTLGSEELHLVLADELPPHVFDALTRARRGNE